MTTTNVVQRRRRRVAEVMQSRLLHVGFELDAARIRWLDEDPSGGDSPDWQGPGFYQGTDMSFVFLGDQIQHAQIWVSELVRARRKAQRELDKTERQERVEIRKLETREKRQARRAEWLAKAPERRARALATLEHVVAIARVVRPVLADALVMGLGVAREAEKVIGGRGGR